MSHIPPHHDPACWGCGDNLNGLHLPQPAEVGATEYEAYFAFDERHQGGPGIVHGGLVAGALDEASGRRLHVNASITDGEEIFAECKAALLHVPLEHFLATPEGRAAGERWAQVSDDSTS